MQCLGIKNLEQLSCIIHMGKHIICYTEETQVQRYQMIYRLSSRWSKYSWTSFLLHTTFWTNSCILSSHITKLWRTLSILCESPTTCMSTTSQENKCIFSWTCCMIFIKYKHEMIWFEEQYLFPSHLTPSHSTIVATGPDSKQAGHNSNPRETIWKIFIKTNLYVFLKI